MATNFLSHAPTVRKWYQTGWGIALAGFISLILLAVVAFLSLVGFYWWKIQKGEASVLIDKISSLQSQKVDDVALASKRAELETTDDPYLGNQNAENVIVEFIDFKCSNCQIAAPIIRKLADLYGYKVKIILRDFPVESIHSGSTQMAEIASCAHEQGRYWLLSDLLFQNQSSFGASLSTEEIKQIAALVNLDQVKLNECLGSGRARIEVNKDYATGFKYQIKGTPTFFINGQAVEGVVSWEEWEKFFKNSK